MKRFCPGCATRHLEMDEAPCALCGRVNLVTAPRPREKMHVLARMVRALLRPLGWPTHALTFAACGFALWAMALHWILPFMGFVEAGFLGLWLLAGTIWTLRLFNARRNLALSTRDANDKATRRARVFGAAALCGRLSCSELFRCAASSGVSIEPIGFGTITSGHSPTGPFPC